MPDDRAPVALFSEPGAFPHGSPAAAAVHREPVSTDHAEPEYVNKREAARILGISTRQLDRLVELGKLRKYRRNVGRTHVAYLVTDLDRLLELAAENA